jgi:hypothetical protein
MGPVHLLVSVLVAIAAVSPAAPAMARESQAVRRASPYNQKPTPFCSLDKVLETFRRNGVAGISATSRGAGEAERQLRRSEQPLSAYAL